MLRRLALDDAPQHLVRQLAARALEGRAHEGHVVHAERVEILLLGLLDSLLLQGLAEGTHVQRLVVNDDAVEVEEDGLNH